MSGVAIDEVLWSARQVLVQTRRWPAAAVVRRVIADLVAEHEHAARPAPGALAAAQRAFGLTPTEVTLLALVAAVEIDPRIGALFAAAQGAADALRPTVGTLCELVGAAEGLAALVDGGVLRRHRLLVLDGDAPLAFRPVRCPDAVWSRLVQPQPARQPAQPRVDALIFSDGLAQQLREVGAWMPVTDGGERLVVVWGRAGSGRDAVAQAILAERERRVLPVRGEALVDDTRCVELERDARWTDATPIVTSEQPAPSAAALAWLARATTPCVWIQEQVPDWLVELTTPARVVHVPALDFDQRLRMWQRLIGGDADLEQELTSRYRFGPGRAARVVALTRAEGYPLELAAITRAARATSRAGIAVLAERLPPRPRDELIVAPTIARELDQAMRWARSYARMYGAWGLTTSVARARGMTSLFAGPPGTGKTLAAQILAGVVERELFRVDLSQAVSKWLGETEKNLARLFDEAEDAGCILFFDEADALFAKRTEVKDAHDRYANLETGYLLQRLEAHDGIVVLATNRRQDLDSAFLRRFGAVIEFLPPGEPERVELWRRHLPAAERCAADVDVAALARMFELSGGQIRNAVIGSVAAVVSSDQRPIEVTARVAMTTLVAGATRELVRAGRLVHPPDFGPWATQVAAALRAPQEPRPR